MIHYFGQAQQIEKFQKFCNKHKLLLIEDNAHGHGGMYKGELLGTFGDIGISSPRKILNLPSGGNLWIKNQNILFCHNLGPYPLSLIKYLQTRIYNYYPSLRYSVNKIIKKRQRFEDYEIFRESPISDYTIDKHSKNKIEQTNWVEICKARRSVYNEWQYFALKNNLTPIYSKLKPDANPWGFPVYTKTPQEAIKWLYWGLENKKPVFFWPNLPKDIITRNSESFNRWKKLICFGIT